MNSGPITKFLQNITTIMAAVSVAVVAIPAVRAAEPDLVSALRDKGAQIMPLGTRGGLTGYLVTPVGGAGYSLYVTGDGHGVAGLLYGSDGMLITGGQLAAVRGENRPAGTAPKPLPILAPSGAASVAPVSRETGPPGCSVIGIAPPEGASTMNAHGVGARNPAVPVEVVTRVTANGVSRAALFERSASAFGFTLGERGPLVVLFGDPLCPWSRSGVARIGREAMAGSCGCMSCRWRCWARLRRTARRGSPQVPIRRKPGSHGQMVHPACRPGSVSRAITPYSIPGASAPFH